MKIPKETESGHDVSLKTNFALDPNRVFLNHGSFGACPRAVLQRQRELCDELESDPIEFLAPERSLLPKIELVRRRVALEVNSDPKDLVFTTGATDAVNAVAGSIKARQGDQWVVTTHEYNACRNTLRYHAERMGVELVTVDIPGVVSRPEMIIDPIKAAMTSRTRFMLLNHVSSASAMVVPVAALVEIARDHDSLIMIDGAHAPGMLPLDLEELKADFYCGNHHKWWCGPKTSGFLHVDQAHQEWVFPGVISHGLNTKWRTASEFQTRFDWTGTRDPTPLLATPTAIDCVGDMVAGGWPQIWQQSRGLLRVAIAELDQQVGPVTITAPESMRGSMATVLFDKTAGLTIDQAKNVQRCLRERHRIEVPCMVLPGSDRNDRLAIRLSAAVHNEPQDYVALATSLKLILPTIPGMRDA